VQHPSAELDGCTGRQARRLERVVGEVRVVVAGVLLRVDPGAHPLDVASCVHQCERVCGRLLDLVYYGAKLVQAM
jgi:hypothetical protein